MAPGGFCRLCNGGRYEPTDAKDAAGKIKKEKEQLMEVVALDRARSGRPSSAREGVKSAGGDHCVEGVCDASLAPCKERLRDRNSSEVDSLKASHLGGGMQCHFDV